jgi:restriction endonuclease
MIVTRDDLMKANSVLVEMHHETEDGEIASQKLFAERPHLLMVLGYDEFRTLADDEKGNAELKRLYGFDPLHTLESVYRDTASGAWYRYLGMQPGTLLFNGPSPEFFRKHSVNQWLKVLRNIYSQPDPAKRTLWLPSIWTPQIQLEQRAFLGNVASDLIQAVHHEKRELREIPWRQLEELVAELLRSRGLDIFVTPRSADGGRDIIARGELISGEPMLLAIEVKQKAVVGLIDVQRALRANEDFPALMLATAGRFSAGVVQEKDLARNKLRLFLKDGIALTQWIESYIYKKTGPGVANSSPNPRAQPR